MKRIRIFGLGVLLWASINSHAAQTAQARIYCLSLRFQQGTDQIGSTLGLTTIASSINGELAPTFDAPTHFSGFLLDSVIFDGPIPGNIEFDVPPFADANQNGFPDFFETSQGVSRTTVGSYEITGVDRGNVTAKWTRPAGSKDGTCILTLTSTLGFGKMDFTHSFELIEYAGPLTYTPGVSNVTGAVNFTQTGDPSSQFIGPIRFIKSPTNRFDELNLRPEDWTNASSSLTFHISNDFDSFFRDLDLKTNYFGFVEFDDGDPNTPDDVDYSFWFLSIDDVNDSNGNGIPDFSDDPGSGTVRQPTVLLNLGNTDLSFSISSTIGRTVEIQETTSLSQTNWATVRSFSPTNDPQVVTLPRPTEGTKFWRVRVP
jgi:hypothetical protein